jgi:hypothetical protein
MLYLRGGGWKEGRHFTVFVIMFEVYHKAKIKFYRKISLSNP